MTSAVADIWGTCEVARSASHGMGDTQSPWLFLAPEVSQHNSTGQLFTVYPAWSTYKKLLKPWPSRNNWFTNFHSMVVFHSYVNVYQRVSIITTAVSIRFVVSLRFWRLDLDGFQPQNGHRNSPRFGVDPVGVSIVIGVPQYLDGFCYGKSIYKWMRTGGTPISTESSWITIKSP